MKLAMLGAAHVHASGYADICNSLENVQILFVYDGDLERAKGIAALCGATASNHLAECLTADIDAVMICSENNLHLELVRTAAAAGKHILCEKPLATTVEDAVAIVELCEKAGVRIQTAFPCRYHPAVTRAKEILEQGKLGDMLAVRATNHGQMPGGWFSDPILAGGGALMDHSVHVVDLLRFLLQDEFDTVYALSARRFHDIATEDCGMLSLELKSGVIVTLDPSWSRPASYPTWGNVTMELVGTKGTLFVDLFAQNIEWFREGALSYQWVPFGTDMNRLMLEDFVDRIRKDMAVAISGIDGLRATEVVASAYLSAASGQTCKLGEYVK